MNKQIIQILLRSFKASINDLYETKLKEKVLLRVQRYKKILTGKKAGGIGPPGIPSLGGICPMGEGAGPAFCNHLLVI